MAAMWMRARASAAAAFSALGFDAADGQTLLALAVRAAVVIGYAATAGLAVRVFLATSDVGRFFGWGF